MVWVGGSLIFIEGQGSHVGDEGSGAVKVKRKGIYLGGGGRGKCDSIYLFVHCAFVRNTGPAGFSILPRSTISYANMKNKRVPASQIHHGYNQRSCSPCGRMRSSGIQPLLRPNGCLGSCAITSIPILALCWRRTNTQSGASRSLQVSGKPS